MFVDRLFRGLESESYLTGCDPATPPPAAAPTGTPPTNVPASKTAVSKPPPSKPQSAVPPQPIKFHSGVGPSLCLVPVPWGVVQDWGTKQELEEVAVIDDTPKIYGAVR